MRQPTALWCVGNRKNGAGRLCVADFHHLSSSAAGIRSRAADSLAGQQIKVSLARI